MEKQVYEIDANGYLIEIHVADPAETKFITIDPPQGLYKAKWMGSAWVEGLAQTELDAIKNEPKPPDPDVELFNAINTATTLDELKKALTGMDGKQAKVMAKLK